MEILIIFGVVWIVGALIGSWIWVSEASYTDPYPLEILWWPIWLGTVGLMRVLKSMKRAISDEWKKP